MKLPAFTSTTVLSRLFLALGAASLASSAFAAVAVSNLAETDIGSSGIFFTPDQRSGTGFSVASGTDYTLNSIIVKGTVSSGSANDLVMTLYSDNGSGLPGSSLATLNFVGQNSGLFTFDPASVVTLTAGTTYLWALQLNDTGEFRVRITTSTAESGLAGWSIADNIISSGDGGGSWSAGAGISSLFSVDATAVPEPSTSLMGLGAVVLLCGIRRRR